MYTKEYKNWISRKNAVPLIIKTIDSFKKYWANMIALVNQMAVPVLQHGYSTTAMDNNALVALYGDLLANFGAGYAATQETMKSQADSLVTMQNQLANIQQFCMAIGQQPPCSLYAPTQQQCKFINHNKRNGGSQNSGHGVPQQSTMSYGNPGGSQQQALHPPTPYKCWEDWNYCHTYGSDVDDTHTSAMCGKPGPMHNPNAGRANIMGGLVAEMHKTILPSAFGHTSPNCCPQQRPPLAYSLPGGTAWQQPTPPVQFGRMPLASGIYLLQTTMSMWVYQPDQGMMMNVGQYPPSARNMPMMLMGQQPMAAPMMMNLLDISSLLVSQRSYLPRNHMVIPTQVHSLYFSRYTSYHFIERGKTCLL